MASEPHRVNHGLLALFLGALLVAACLGGCTPKPADVAATLTVQATLGAGTLQAATVPPGAATAEPTATIEPPTATAEPPTAMPTPTAEPIGTAEPTATPEPGLAVVSFACEIADIPTGKRVTFTWQTTGATSARIVSGTSIRFPQIWEVAPSGTLAVDLSTTYYANPAMTLIASDGAGHEVQYKCTVAWPCAYSYFFPNGPAACPHWEATTSPAADGAFQHGRMVWLQEIRAGSTAINNQILVLYEDGSWVQFDDTWSEGQPESDPGIVPPAGLYQPIRGFGKLWRDNAAVRDKLGWALAPEQGYTATWQWQMRESLPSVAYVRTVGNQVIELAGQRGGNWRVMAA